MSILDKASLVITPTSYKEGKLYSIVPKDGSGDMTWIRATDATRVNKGGLNEMTPYNLLQRSEEFENSYWGKVRTTIIPNTTISPNGTLTADSLVEDSQAGGHYLSKSSICEIGKTYTNSIYAKANTRSWILVQFGNTWASFNLSNGTIGSKITVSGNPGSFKIQDVGNGWYRCSATYTAIATNHTAGYYLETGDDAYGYLGDGVSSFYVWGAQLVEGSEPKEYFSTTNRQDVPRITHPISGGIPSLLIEPQRTNLISHSSNVGVSPWNALGTEVLLFPNEAIAPDGTMTAARYLMNSGSARARFIVNIQPNTTYTMSFWAKNISMTQGNCAITVAGATNYNYIPLTNTETWTRISHTFTSTNTAVASANFRLIQGGNIGGEILFWGAQLEVGSNATSYIPTTNATVTRNADVVAKTNISDLIGQTEGTLFVDFNYEKNDPNDNFIAILSDNSSNNGVWLDINPSSIFVAIIRANGSSSVIFSLSAANFQFGRKKIAFSYKSGATNLYINGVKISVTNTNSFTFNNTVSKFNLGCFWNNSSQLNNTINSSTIFKQALTNAECISLTTL